MSEQSNEKRRRLTVFVTDDTYRAVRLEAARLGLTMQETLHRQLDVLRHGSESAEGR